MKIRVLAIAVSGLIGVPALAQAVGPPEVMSWYDRLAQFGFGGITLGIVWWMIAKTIPDKDKAVFDAALKVAEVQAAALDRVCQKLDQLGDKFGTSMELVKAEIRAGNDSHLGLLRNALHPPK